MTARKSPAKASLAPAGAKTPATKAKATKALAVKAPAPKAPAVKAAPKAPRKGSTPAARPAAAKPAAPKPPKPKLVRDSFTMPQADFALVATLKARALDFRRPTKKSELLRAGLQALARMDETALRQALESLAPLKPGRPKKGA